MLVDATGRFISQRKQERLALVSVAPTAGGLAAHAPGQPEIAITPPAASDATPVTIWDDRMPAFCAAAEVNEWFSEFPRSLLPALLPGRHGPACGSRWSRPGDTTSFADAYPLLVCTTASLDDLNRRTACNFRWIASGPISSWPGMRRGARMAGSALKLVPSRSTSSNLARACVVTTIDQAKGVKTGKEPLHSLAKFRFLQVPGISGAIFGQNAIPRVLGRIVVGDMVQLSRRSQSRNSSGQPPIRSKTVRWSLSRLGQPEQKLHLGESAQGENARSRTWAAGGGPRTPPT